MWKLLKVKLIGSHLCIKNVGLLGVRGLTAIENYFERVKLQGKGYEDNDLNVIMKTYEYWCHRLFPKFPFDTCIEKLETLGSKKATQVLHLMVTLLFILYVIFRLISKKFVII